MMIHFQKTLGPLCAAAIFNLATAAPATAQNDVRAYIFGNSLVHHLSDTQETTVPFWLHQLSRFAGREFAMDGQWGQLRSFATDLPPVPNWSFKELPNVWNPSEQGFSQAGVNTILLTPTNFIQYQPADTRYDGNNPTRTTPLKASLQLLDWVSAHTTKPTVLIYEGWADMGTFSKKFPPYKRAISRYHRYNRAAYHDWYSEYLAQIKTARPELDIRLIPVAKMLSKLLTETALSSIPVTDLYVDNAPHGTPTLYFLASLITYGAMFGEAPPVGYPMPDSVHPLVRENYPMILDLVAKGLPKSTAKPAPIKTVPAITPPAPSQTPAPASPPKLVTAQSTTAPQNPPLAMGLDGIADWSAQQPFVNIMKSARTWVGHTTTKWGAWNAADLATAGYLDDNGWPTKIPANLTHIEAFILTNQPPEATSMIGRYRLTYRGTGDISVGGRAQNVTTKPGEIWFDYTPGEDLVSISISTSDPQEIGDYIRDIAVVKEENIPLFEVGALFNPHWIRRIRDLRSVRFMDWMFTNGSPISRWNQRPKITDYSYVSKGAPVEIMVALANEIGVDPWFNMPHQGNAEYNRKFASYVLHHLNPKLKTYVEYSNEIWNFTFPQTQWAMEQAAARWGDGTPDGWMQIAGIQAAKTARIWREVYGPAAKDRLVRVVATHTDWPGLEEALLQAPKGQADGDPAPVSEFDAYAVTGYFGHDLGSDELAPQVLEWIAQSVAAATKEAQEKGLTEDGIQTYVAAHQYDFVDRKAAQALLDGSLKHLLQEALPYQAETAKRNGLQLVMYEGGTHVVGIESWANNEVLGAFFNHFNYTPELAGVYVELLNGWQAVGGTLFNAFVDVARTSQWGSWGALRHLDDSNPRWDVLMDFNTQKPAWWADREPGTFDHGVLMTGTNDGEELRGTPLIDILLGYGGDDVLFSLGGADHLHGGAGHDRAHLAGGPDDYVFEKDGITTLAVGPDGTIRMFSIEVISFEDQPGFKLPVSRL